MLFRESLRSPRSYRFNLIIVLPTTVSGIAEILASFMDRFERAFILLSKGFAKTIFYGSRYWEIDIIFALFSNRYGLHGIELTRPPYYFCSATVFALLLNPDGHRGTVSEIGILSGLLVNRFGLRVSLNLHGLRGAILGIDVVAVFLLSRYGLHVTSESTWS